MKKRLKITDEFDIVYHFSDVMMQEHAREVLAAEGLTNTSSFKK